MMTAIAHVIDTSPLGHIRGIADFWMRQTGRDARPPPRPMADRIMLDVLGLGIEQATTCLLHNRPDFSAFKAWVLATAGAPDPERVARYNAWIDGARTPAATAERLAMVDAMAPVLDAADLAHWDEHGFVVLRAAIDRAEANAAAAVLWRVLDATPGGDPATWYRARPNGIMVQYFQDPALEIARRSPRIHKAFAQLWGTSDLWATTDRMSFNPPERPGHPFRGPHPHWDISLAHPIPFDTGGILYLTETTAEQGALQVVPGLHRRLATWLEELGDRDPRTVDWEGQTVRVPGAAGDLVIWRQELAHGASSNSTDRPRMAQYVNMYSPALEYQSVWR